MQVQNLVSWAGRGFSYAAGDIIELPDDVAIIRIEAGLASALEPVSEAATDLPRRKKGRTSP